MGWNSIWPGVSPGFLGITVTACLAVWCNHFCIRAHHDGLSLRLGFRVKNSNFGLKEFRTKTSELIHSNKIWNSQRMPSSYYRLKNALRKLFDDKIERITKDDFYEKARESDVTDREKQDTLLESLHLLGICLWYKDIKEFDMLVLNPDWITNGIYKVINWAHNNSKPTISLDDFAEIFDDEKERYPKDQFIFILKLMKKYELAFFSKDDSKVTIPHILKEDQPAKLPDFPITESLMIKYVSEQPLPPNTVCRLIVRHHTEIENDNEVWRYGVVLKHKKNAIALVYEDDRNIIITTKGLHKTEYISNLSGTMDEIFQSYRSKKPELQYRIVKVGDGGIFVPSETVRTHVEMGQQYLDPQLKEFVDLTSTAQAYGIVNNNYIINSNNTTSNFFNFYDCNINLQGDINSLIRMLDSKNDSDIIDELRDIISDLKDAKAFASPREAKEEGLLGRLGNFIEDLGDENSRTHKVIMGLKQGVKIAHKIFEAYNKISPAIGSGPFLGG